MYSDSDLEMAMLAASSSGMNVQFSANTGKVEDVVIFNNGDAEEEF